MSFTITHNIGVLTSALDNLSKSQIPQATAWALNDTAFDALKAVQAEMTAQFDRPTRFALNAFMVWRANKRTLEAKVQERPSVGKRHFLKVQGTGGVRPATGLEKASRARLGYAGRIGSVAPARGAARDAFGGWSASERKRALAQVQAQKAATAAPKPTSGKGVKKRAQYFVPKAGSKLSPGIWKRDGETMTKILNISASGASYAKRIDWHESVRQRAAAVYAGHFERALIRAIRTAR